MLVEVSDQEVCALLDSGAYSNYISEGWLIKQNLHTRIVPVNGEYIQLGGTNKQLPVLGKIKLETAMGGASALLSFVVFESQRNCIIGLESLVLHFLEVFKEKLELLKSTLSNSSKRQLNAIAKLFPTEPGKVQLDPADFRTELEEGEEIIIATGQQTLAPEEDTMDEEFKEIFAIPVKSVGLTEELIGAMLPEELRSKAQGSFDFHKAMSDLLRSVVGTEAFTYTDWKGLNWPAIDIELRDDAPPHLHCKVRNIVQALYEPAKNALRKLVQDNILRSDHACTYTSAIVVVEKPKQPDEPRICGDYVALNKIIKHLSSAVPDPKKLLDTFKRFKYYAETDWIKGFHQVPLSAKTSKLLAINTPLGTFVPNFLPMGVQPASGILAHIARAIFGNLGDYVISVQDNLLIGGDTLEELYNHTKEVLARAIKYNVKLSPTKTKFGVREISFFGYMVGYGKYWVNPARQSAVVDIPFPKSLKALQHFLGLALFVSPFIQDYSQLTAPLTGLANSKTEWKKVEEWQGDYLDAFQRVKDAVAGATELHLPDMDAEWVLRVDASDVACGGTLLQRVRVSDTPEQWEMQPIAYTHHKFSSIAINWSVLEKELYALVFSLQRLDYYVRLKHFTAETDHSNILYLQQSLIPKLVRWKLFIESYLMTLRHIPGKTNVVADALSRIYALTVKMLNTEQLNVMHTMGEEYVRLATTELAENYDIDSCEHDMDIKHTTLNALRPTSEGIPPEIWKEVHMRARGHRGAKRTYLELGRRYPEVKVPMELIQQLVDACPICQKFKSDLFITLKTARHVLTAEHHRAQVSVDVAGMEEDSYGMNTCFVMVNHNTKLIYLYAAKGKEEKHTVNAILSYIGMYGLMERILSDPGGEFTGEFTKKLMQKLGIKWNLSIAERPQSHGTERTVGRALEAVRILMAQEQGPQLAWSEPAVLATTAYLLNSEINEETGFSAFDLVFGKGEFAEFPDMTGVTGKPKLEQYLAALQSHLDDIRGQANTRRLTRQQQRQEAGEPPGNHEYVKDDLVFIHDDAPMRERKFKARQLGPYQVVSQDQDGAVMVKSLVDGKTLQRHHNRLRIFEGTLREATILARLDNNEDLILAIDAFRGNVYQRMQTQWHVRWQDGTDTWENYKTVENCVQLTTYAESISYLKHRYGSTGKDFKEWARKINKLTHEELSTGEHGFYPTLDPQLRQAFAISIQYFDQNDELQSTRQTSSWMANSRPMRRQLSEKEKMQSSDWSCYLRAHLVKVTPTRADVFVPALSERLSYRKFPAKGAYLRSMTPAELLQFAKEIPDDHAGAADQLIADTDFRQLVWPEQWQPLAQLQATIRLPIAESEQQEEQEIDEELEVGDRTGEKAQLQTRGKWYSMTVGKQFPDGDYLCVFDTTGNDIKVPASRLRFERDRVLLRGRGRRRGDGQ